MQTLQQILHNQKKIDNLLRGGKVNVNIKKNAEQKNNRTKESRVEKQHIYSKIDSELRLVWKRLHSLCVQLHDVLVKKNNNNEREPDKNGMCEYKVKCPTKKKEYSEPPKIRNPPI